MLTTQQFANLCSTSKKTIIYYDRIGLLKPTQIMGRNRIYTEKQVLLYQKIYLLQTFDLTLAEIKKYLVNDGLLLEMFEKRKLHLNEEQQTIKKKINKVSEFITNLKNNNTLVVPKVVQINTYYLYAIKKDGRYVDIKDHQLELFNRLKHIKRIYAGGTIFFNIHYSPSHSEMLCCALTREKKPAQIAGVQLIKVPSYKTVTYTHYGPYKYLSYVWQFMDKFIAENNLKRSKDLPPREFYIHGELTNQNENSLITELHIPIQ